MVAPQITRSALQEAMLKTYQTILQNKANRYNNKLKIRIK